MDISQPLAPGDKIKYKWGNEEKTDEVAESFWEDRPKGGREFCYRTRFGDVVPLSSIISSYQERPQTLHSAGLMDLNEGRGADPRELLKVLIEGAELPLDLRAMLIHILDDDIESLSIAKAMIERKLKRLQENLEAINQQEE